MMFGIHMCIAGTLSPHIPLIISVHVKKEHLDISLDIGTIGVFRPWHSRALPGISTS